MADRNDPRGKRDFDPDRPRRGGGFDRPRRQFEGPRRDFDRPRRPFEGPRRDFDRPRRDFEPDRPRRDFDRPRRDSDPQRPRRDFDRPPQSGGGGPDRRPFRPRGTGFGGPRDTGFGGPRDTGFGRPPDRRSAGGPGRPPFRPTGARPAPPPRPDLVGEGEELVAGRRPVSEAFAARRDAKRLIVVPERRAALESIVLHATTLRLPIVEVEGGTLTSVTGFDGHQGIALVVAARPAVSIEDIVARARVRGEEPFVLILDSLEDPQNLGTLLRSAEACGVHGVIYPTRHAAPLTAAAVKSSAGATEHLLLAAVDNLPGTLADLRAAGLRLVGADEGAGLRYSEADLRGPLALVVGSEERGISGALRRRLDMTVRIPMRGRIASLNAAVAGSVLLFAAAEQRGVPESGDRPPVEDPPLAAADPPAAESETAARSEPAADSEPEASEPEAESEPAADSEPEDLLPVGPPAESAGEGGEDP
jgi:23S rRNA (guanosine2251-2'-O)-methyltransferase